MNKKEKKSIYKKLFSEGVTLKEFSNLINQPEPSLKIDIQKLTCKQRHKLIEAIDETAFELEECGTAEHAALDIACQQHGIELDEYYSLHY